MEQWGCSNLRRGFEGIKKTYKIKSGECGNLLSVEGSQELLRYHVSKAGTQKGEPTMMRWLLVKI